MSRYLKIKIAIWLAGCMVIAIIPFNDLWLKLPRWLSPDGLQNYGLFHWGVLGLCGLWLWLKRRDIIPKIREGRPGVLYILAGLSLIALSVTIPKSDYFLVFFLLLGWMGLFTIIFGHACKIPLILLSIYGFGLAFSPLMTEHLGQPMAAVETGIIIFILEALGLSIINNGLVLHLTSRTGDVVTTTIAPACAGYATIGVFIALFALMMLDIRLPNKKVPYIFLFGLIGTWLQNIIRILITIGAGYYWGEDTLQAMHLNVSYVIFPLWYALFAYVYLRNARQRPETKPAKACTQA